MERSTSWYANAAGCSLSRSYIAYKPMRKVAAVALYNLFAVLVLLLVLEGGIRIFVPDITGTGTDRRLFQDDVYGPSPGLRPEVTGISNEQTFTVDANGFWAYTAGTNPQLDGWLFLGDSVTMGIGVAPDSTFAGRIALAQDTLNVLNPSLIGYSSRDYVNILGTLLTQPSDAYRDLKRVTVFWCLNDVYAGSTASAEPGQNVRHLAGTFLTFVRQHVHTYHWLKALVFDRPRTYYEHDERLYTESLTNLEAAFTDLQALHKLASDHDIAFAVVILPYAYQLRTTDRVVPQAVLRQELRADSIQIYDPFQMLSTLSTRPEDLYLYGDGIHFSSLGHKAIASFVLKHLH